MTSFRRGALWVQWDPISLGRPRPRERQLCCWRHSLHLPFLLYLVFHVTGSSPTPTSRTPLNTGVTFSRGITSVPYIWHLMIILFLSHPPWNPRITTPVLKSTAKSILWREARSGSPRTLMLSSRE